MAARAVPSILVAVLGLAVAAGLFVLGGAPAPEGPPSEATRLAREVDNLMREQSAALRARASTLADLPRLAVAVATDAATVQDLTEEELAFRLKPGETIEIGQVKDGEVISLLRKPRDSTAAPPLDKAGTTVRAGAGGFMVSEVVSITPAVQTGVERGALAVSWLIDARPLLAGVKIPARVELGGKVVAASPVAFVEGVETSLVAAGEDVSAGVNVVAAKPAAAGGLFSPLRLGAFILAGVSLAVAFALSRRRGGRGAGASSSSASGPAPVSAELPAVGTPYSPAMAATDGPSSSPPNSIGAVFGRYSVIRKLGSGGMAEVFLARGAGEAGFQKDVALKIMHRNMAQLPEVVDHFLDEARLASRLSHPNIVQIMDLGKTGDDYYIAMEFVDGYDLDYILDRTQARGALVPARVAIAIARKVCLGLDAAHAATASDGTPLDIVHRDVKAENVLISRRGEVKVADFGIAKANQRSRVTQFGMVKGTAAYMAPEHRVGRPVDKRADVYGVGAVFYELMTCTEINLDLESLAHLGREGWPHLTPVAQLRSDVPPGVDAIIWKALAFDREDRYPSCSALEEALEGLAVENGLEIGDKAIHQWMDQQIAFLDGAPASKRA